MLEQCSKQTVAVLKYAQLMPLHATHNQMGDAARGCDTWSHLILHNNSDIALAIAAFLDLTMAIHALCPVVSSRLERAILYL